MLTCSSLYTIGEPEYSLNRTDIPADTGFLMRMPVWGWSFPGPAATTSPSQAFSLLYFFRRRGLKSVYRIRCQRCRMPSIYLLFCNSFVHLLVGKKSIRNRGYPIPYSIQYTSSYTSHTLRTSSGSKIPPEVADRVSFVRTRT